MQYFGRKTEMEQKFGVKVVEEKNNAEKGAKKHGVGV
jgi:hypothetical protein